MSNTEYFPRKEDGFAFAFGASVDEMIADAIRKMPTHLQRDVIVLFLHANRQGVKHKLPNRDSGYGFTWCKGEPKFDFGTNAYGRIKVTWKSISPSGSEGISSVFPSGSEDGVVGSVCDPNSSEDSSEFSDKTGKYSSLMLF
jgi:hypothetical protein